MKVLIFAVSMCLVASAADSVSNSASWDPKTAAAYLDQRAAWWTTWPAAAKDHETFCISCHTALPYALGRPALRGALGEAGESANERKLLENVSKRVRMWDSVEPFYKDRGNDPKAAESRATEAVLNALILASHDAPSGKLSADTRQAFKNLWALQLADGPAKGAFNWMNFHYAPWEGEDSQNYGAALAAVAVGLTPKEYTNSAEIRNNVQALQAYLQRTYAAQPAINRVTLLWASARWPELLSAAQKQSIMADVYKLQQDDGGWSLSSIIGDWKRKDGTPQETKSDGYATGLITLALLEAGASDTEPSKRALAWLARNQNKAEGFWPASSVNKQRDPASDIGRFMSDAATGYAVRALSFRR